MGSAFIYEPVRHIPAAITQNKVKADFFTVSSINRIYRKLANPDVQVQIIVPGSLHSVPSDYHDSWIKAG
jgi:hypothetical protein